MTRMTRGAQTRKAGPGTVAIDRLAFGKGNALPVCNEIVLLFYEFDLMHEDEAYASHESKDDVRGSRTPTQPIQLEGEQGNPTQSEDDGNRLYVLST